MKSIIDRQLSTIGQGRFGLSSFGERSARFQAEVLARSWRRLGEWHPARLELLQEEASEPLPPRTPPQVKFDLDLTLVLKGLQEERKRARGQKEKESGQAMEKMLERVMLRERDSLTRGGVQKITIQSGASSQPEGVRWTVGGQPSQPAPPLATGVGSQRTMSPDITYRTRPPAASAPPVRPPALGDRELRKAADKIYRMIEGRLRHELRRSGR